MPLRDLKALPKAHLHLHLEGGMRPATLLELANHYDVPVTLEGDGSFGTFIRLYRAAVEVLRTPDDVARLVREVAEDAAAAGATWVEPSEWITLAQATRLGLATEEAVLEVVLDAARRAERDTGVGVGIMVASNRTRPPAEAVALARLAERYAGRGVVSFGLADDELRGAPEPYAEAFAIARGAGLISSPHAGEHGGPHSVIGALEALGAQRIQHGVRSAEDPMLLQRLAAEEITLDVCPTSNVQLKVCADYASHPLPVLLAAGVKVSLNADDPLFFGSGVLEEYELARHTFHLDDNALASIAATSIRASGAPQSLKTTALNEINRWLSQPA
jgi:adenosine deaminase